MNKLLDSKNENANICQHSQHTRLLKEEDEVWISSEDLNTEDSSDEETRNKFKRKSKRQLKKQQSKTKSASYLSKIHNPLSSKSHTGESSTECLLPNLIKTHDPADLIKLDILPFELQSGSSCFLSDNETSRSLELPHIGSWRPVRGSQQLEKLQFSEGTVTQDNGFYDNMLHNITSMRFPQEVEMLFDESLKINKEEQKTFKYLKTTPEVQASLAIIKKMDEEIASTIDLYKTERADRLLLQEEMCKELSENKMGQEKGTNIFLELCDFETASDLERAKDEENDLNESREYGQSLGEMKNTCPEFSKNFIDRNKEVAKEGFMAKFSLTDEEKSKLDKLLSEETASQANYFSNSQLSNVDRTAPFNEESSLALSCIGDVSNNIENVQDNLDNNDTAEDEWNMEDHLDSTSNNAFSISQCERKRINEIDNQLKKFEDIPKESRALKIEINDDKFWKQFILEQSLKDVDEKLEKLQQSYNQAESKLSNVVPKKYNVTFEFDDKTTEEQLLNAEKTDHMTQGEVSDEDTESILSTNRSCH